MSDKIQQHSTSFSLVVCCKSPFCFSRDSFASPTGSNRNCLFFFKFFILNFSYKISILSFNSRRNLYGVNRKRRIFWKRETQPFWKKSLARLALWLAYYISIYHFSLVVVYTSSRTTQVCCPCCCNSFVSSLKKKPNQPTDSKLK